MGIRFQHLVQATYTVTNFSSEKTNSPPQLKMMNQKNSMMAQLLAAKLKRKLSKLIKPTKKASQYITLPPTDPHQEEVDENALNEALEARLMEIIASSPALDAPITIHVGDTEILATRAQDPASACLVPSTIQTS